jgi:uncharacterized membrane protein YfcA
VEPSAVFLFFLAGGVAGFLAGIFGAAGGVLLLPLLIICFQWTGASSLVSTHLALGTGLLAVALASAAESFRQRREPPSLAPFAQLITVGGVAGVLGGSWLACTMSGKTVQQFFALFLLFAASQAVGRPRKTPKQPGAMQVRTAVTGVVGGFVSAWSVNGGEVAERKILYSLLGIPLSRSLTLAKLSLIGTGLAGAAAYAFLGRTERLLPPSTWGFVGILQAAAVAVSFFLFERVGARISIADGSLPRKLYAVIVIAVAARMFFS